MSFEKHNPPEGERSPEAIEELAWECLEMGNEEEALRLIEQLPDGEEKLHLTAEVGRNYVEAGNFERAREIVGLLMQKDDSSAYAGGVLELMPEEEWPDF